MYEPGSVSCEGFRIENAAGVVIENCLNERQLQQLGRQQHLAGNLPLPSRMLMIIRLLSISLTFRSSASYSEARRCSTRPAVHGAWCSSLHQAERRLLPGSRP